ncbi:hypothetical protein F4821DRAFT_241841 [Hypoxylon rubiginosum]|uniref:Uncharacterized protein n=1 Tax=Hypoxylon rubiginosum TaxID=110542 RepID=A0ACC0CX14_9PEZI|nr:hypothetical protein F4821DRAFT_241841 [Hypoxylon rubiginosum]
MDPDRGTMREESSSGSEEDVMEIDSPEPIFTGEPPTWRPDMQMMRSPTYVDINDRIREDASLAENGELRLSLAIQILDEFDSMTLTTMFRVAVALTKFHMDRNKSLMDRNDSLMDQMETLLDKNKTLKAQNCLLFSAVAFFTFFIVGALILRDLRKAVLTGAVGWTLAAILTYEVPRR